MGYNRSIQTLEAMIPQLADALDGKITMWRHPKPLLWAYKIREALYIAKLYPDRYPEHAALALRATLRVNTELGTVTLFPQKHLATLTGAGRIARSRALAEVIQRETFDSPDSPTPETPTESVSSMAQTLEVKLMSHQEPEPDGKDKPPLVFTGPKDPYSIAEDWRAMQDSSRANEKIVWRGADLMPDELEKVFRFASTFKWLMFHSQGTVTLIPPTDDPALLEAAWQPRNG